MPVTVTTATLPGAAPCAVVDDYARLFLDQVPLLDVRAPVEFLAGAFAQAVNIPLLDDAQREQIGTCYQQQGQDAAIALGNTLATPEIRAQRLNAWKAFVQAHPQGVLYCFRGGLRSRITQSWLREQGIDYPRVEGGYKAMRRYLVDTLASLAGSLPLWLVSGRTGSGKTDLLWQLPHYLDLEGLAMHRGSTFGYRVAPQPAQISFENAIAIDLLKHAHHQGQTPLVLEDESRLIGRLSLPLPLQNAMKEAPLLVLEASLEDREDRILRDYIVRQREDYQGAYGDAAGARFADYVLHNLARIRTRLGGERHQQLHRQWEAALLQLESTGNPDAFRPGIRRLLVEYYDPMYDWQLSRKAGEILCRGDAATILAWVARQRS